MGVDGYLRDRRYSLSNNERFAPAWVQVRVRMPRMSAVITLQNVTLAFGAKPVLEEVNLTIESGSRCCITGYNGSGKTTLLNVINGIYQPDSGQVTRGPNLTFSALPQTVDFGEALTVFDAVAAGLGPIGEILGAFRRFKDQSGAETEKHRQDLRSELDAAEAWHLEAQVDAILDRLKLDSNQAISELSGGWGKRVAIARSLVANPEVWLLDEPTNHLDIPTIEWLQSELIRYQGTLIFVSHDRALMEALSTCVVDVDRGVVKLWPCGYTTFLERREAERERLAEVDARFDAKLAEEEVWIRKGIQARRTRNEGRVRALKQMRAERAERVSQSKLLLEVDAGQRSGKIVSAFKNVSFELGGESLIKDMNWVVQRGDRIGLVGPNGVGKSTLIKLLLGEYSASKGTIHTGTKIEVAYFDQSRAALDQEMTVNEAIGAGRDFIEINGQSIHVVSYLKRFMFDSAQSRGKIRTLSGGQQNRLLMAQLFAQPANLLILDEPTNDLDVETLELLETLLHEYSGTVLLVSHDRRFLDEVVTSLLVFKGEGQVEEQIGGFSEWVERGGSLQPAQAQPVDSENSGDAGIDYEARKKKKGERRRLQKSYDEMPSRIQALESEEQDLMRLLSAPDFFERPETEQKAAYDSADKLRDEIAGLYDLWAELEARLESV